VAKLVDPPRVGAVTGVVGAAGGLGGFVPPLVMGTIYGQVGDYSLGLALLALMSLLTGIFTWRVFGARARPRTVSGRTTT
jgi:NNP family nitrate/nitrite transporter-like MFS transporter